MNTAQPPAETPMRPDTPDTQAVPARQSAPGRAGQAARAGHAAAPIPSAELLRGQRVIEIDHEGQRYRLQSTRQGKLILTK